MYNGKTINAQAILDSGAEGIYCHNDFIAKHKICTHPLERPLRARNVDGTLNKQGIIHHAAILRVEMGAQHRENIEVAITNIGKHDLLLGTDWLQAHNPSIDWVRCKIRMDHCPATCFPLAPEEPKDPMLGYFLLSLDWEEQYDDLIEAHYEGIDVSHHVLAHAHLYLTPVVGCTTVSTSLAKNAAKDRFQGIPLAFRKYKKVFSDEEAQ